MITLIVGRSNTGKSALAESLALETGRKVYYVATMKVMDYAGRERVLKHRQQREGKGFITIEREKDIAHVLDACCDAGGSVVLLECVANLVSNLIFDDPSFDMKGIDAKAECERIAGIAADDIKELSGKVRDMIIVTDEYERDGEGYDDPTRFYVRTLSRTNELIKPFCDEVRDLT